MREKVARSAANPDGERVRDVPVKDTANLTKLIDNGGMRFKRGAADFDKANGTELASIVSLAQAMRLNDEKTIAGFRGRHFRFAKTNASLKSAGLSGDYFTIRAGVILRHNGNNAAHDITPDEWSDIADALTNKKPQAVEKRGKGSFRIWTQATIGERVAVVGADVKNMGKDIDVNSIATVFGAEGISIKEDNLVYPETQEEKRSVLTRLNSGRYPASHQDGNSISQIDTGGQTGREEPRGVQKQACMEYPDAGREISGTRFKRAAADLQRACLARRIRRPGSGGRTNRYTRLQVLQNAAPGSEDAGKMDFELDDALKEYSGVKASILARLRRSKSEGGQYGDNQSGQPEEKHEKAER